MEVLEQHQKNFIGQLGEGAALNQFPFPTSKDEDYKYTRLAALKNAELNWAQENISNEAKEEIKAFIVEKNLENVVVFYNGFFNVELSKIEVKNDAAFDWNGKLLINQVFSQLAFTRKEQIYNIPNTSSGLINIIHYIGDENSIYANSYSLSLNDNQKLQIAEYCLGKGIASSFVNINRDFKVPSNAHLSVHADQLINEGAFHMTHNYASVGEKACFDFNAINSGYQILRNNILVDIIGPEGDANIHQAFLGKYKNLLDNHILVNHFAPNTTSNQLVKGVMEGKSRGVFNGKVFVAKDAQKVNAYQTNNNIILDPEAIVDAKPELEIYADDVRCSHGSTTGQINEDALFYLRSRGVGLKAAHQLLLQSFIEEVIEEFNNDTFEAYTKDKLNQILGYDFE